MYQVTQNISQTDSQREDRLKKIEQDIQELWDKYKGCNMHVIRITEGEERQEGTEEVLEVTMTKNLPGINRY